MLIFLVSADMLFKVMVLSTRENVAFQHFWEKKVQLLGTFNFSLGLPRRFKDSWAQKGISESETQWGFPALIVETGQVPS